MIEWFQKGGLFMWPILFSSVFAVGLMVERFLFFVALRKRVEKEAADAFRVSAQSNPLQAAEGMAGQKGLMPEILQAAWDPSHPKVSVAERNVEEVLHTHRPELERHLSTISTLASIQPLLGLLGTVSGMIATFHVISTQGTGNPAALADGISEAMITTEAGLCTALPILLGHNWLRNRQRTVLSLLQRVCARALKEREIHCPEA